jgi:hypothetical protein
MRGEDRHDWVDDLMTSDAWEPPHGFTTRVVSRAMTMLPQQPPRLDLATRAHALAAGVVQSTRGRIEGTAWVLMQYRQLFARF